MAVEAGCSEGAENPTVADEANRVDEWMMTFYS